jgi:hypothetical protein
MSAVFRVFGLSETHTDPNTQKGGGRTRHGKPPWSAVHIQDRGHGFAALTADQRPA